MDRLIAPNTVVAGQADAAPATGTPGYATDGNPATGIPATLWPAYQYNAFQEELIAILSAAGITPDRTTNSQIAAAIKRLVQKTTILADAGAANAYAAVNTPPLTVATWLDGTVQQVKIANSNTGASTYAPDGLTAIPIYGLGLQPLQGGELAAGGTAVFMRATVTGINSGNPICVLMECAGGAQQVAPATKSQHAVQLGQVSGVVGHARNLVMSVAAASASATLTADEIIVESALGGIRYCLPNFNQTINLATTGAGGMDTGSAPTSGYVGLYAGYNPSTGTRTLFARNATSTVLGSVYGGANSPAGITATALVSVWPTNGIGQFVVGFQDDRRFRYSSVSLAIISTQTTTPTSFSVAGAVPPNAKTVKLVANVAGTSSASVFCNIYSSSSGVDQNQLAANPTTGLTAAFEAATLITPQTLYYTAGAGGTMTLTITASGYTI